MLPLGICNERTHSRKHTHTYRHSHTDTAAWSSCSKAPNKFLINLNFETNKMAQCTAVAAKLATTTSNNNNKHHNNIEPEPA